MSMERALARARSGGNLSRSRGDHDAPDKQTPAEVAGVALAAVQRFLSDCVLPRDAVDLEARNPEVIEFAVRQQGQFTDGFAITQVGTDFREDEAYEHSGLLKGAAWCRWPVLVLLVQCNI